MYAPSPESERGESEIGLGRVLLRILETLWDEVFRVPVEFRVVEDAPSCI